MALQFARIKPISLPKGTWQGAFSHDGKIFALHWTLAEDPATPAVRLF